MADIKTLNFDQSSIGTIRSLKHGEKWPVVYIINNDKEAYIGETTNAYLRANQHLAKDIRKSLKKIHLITDDEFNKSAILDIESFLIKYMSADGKYQLQNGNGGLQFHYYYEMEKYERKFKEIWMKLRSKGIVRQELRSIENSDLFKYSPYKSLSTDQYMVVNNILSDLADDIQNGEKSTFIVNGGAGTGKTVLAVYIMKLLMETKSGDLLIEEDKLEESLKDIVRINDAIVDLKIAFVIPMTSLRKTLKKVFKEIKGLRSNMVISPNDVTKDYYDLLVVDEAHRLRRRKNLTQYATFDSNNNKLGLGNDGTELDWIMKSSKYQILFYDPEQSIKPTDVREIDFDKLMLEKKFRSYKLESQLRCSGGNDYVNYVKSIFSKEPPVKKIKLDNYDFRLFNNVKEMTDAIKVKNNKFGLSRNIAGYSWKWNTKNMKLNEIVIANSYDIEIDGNKYIWNTTSEDWVNSSNSVNEIGCIHTIQGYDLNYAGVILGNEIKYDPESEKIIIDNSNHYDRNGKASINTEEELFDYIKNIYVTMLTRGIKGTYVYACDENLRNYLKKFINEN